MRRGPRPRTRRPGPGPLPVLLRLVHDRLAEAVDRLAAVPGASAAVLRARVLAADRLPVKAMVTAGTLLPKERSGAADINKHYVTGPNYLLPYAARAADDHRARPPAAFTRPPRSSPSSARPPMPPSSPPPSAGVLIPCLHRPPSWPRPTTSSPTPS
ncbi:hypothetical protein NKH77_12295 [Streptomyces sp. M19]